MAGNLITNDQIKAALEAYKATHPDASYTLDPVTNKFLLSTGEKDALVWHESGKFKCDDPDLGLALSELVPKPPAIKSRGRAESIAEYHGPANAATTIQAMQTGKDLLYQVSGKAAPSATLALMAASDAGFNLELRDYEHTPIYCKAFIIAKSPDKREMPAVVDIFKDDFVNMLAWKEISDLEEKGADILDREHPEGPCLANGFPRIRQGARIKQRVKDGDNSRIVEVNVDTYLYTKIMSQWVFQARQVQTKAKRNAIVQLLTSTKNPVPILEEEEAADEQMEREMVERSKA
ncbi:MAG: hypothetical protein WC291_08050 [Thermodesulfovibrionales bacterium]|jgi:hypothetical protein